MKKEDLTYLGAIRTPLGEFHYDGDPFTLDAVRQEFVLNGFQRRGQVARLQVVEPKMPTTKGANEHPLLDRASVDVALFVDDVRVDLTNGDWAGFTAGDNKDYKVGALLVDNDKIAVGGVTYYDASNNQRKSFFLADWPATVPATRTPWRQVGAANKQGWVAGPLCKIPQRYQAALKGDVISGQSGLPIISRQSYGPCAISWKLRELQNGDVANTTTLVGYPGDHALAPWSSTVPNDLFANSTNVEAMMFVGERLVFIGTHGYGAPCYGTGQECGDPTSDSKGTHAYPYRLQAWVYKVSDLVAVAQGAKQSWELVPEWFPIDVPMFGHEKYPSKLTTILRPHCSGAAYDETSGRLYVCLLQQDSHGYEPGPLIHAFKVGVGSPPAPPPDAQELAALRAENAILKTQLGDAEIKLAAAKSKLNETAATVKQFIDSFDQLKNL